MFGGEWPYRGGRSVLRVDNGPEHGAEFVELVEEHTPEIRIVHGISNNPNSQAYAENMVGRVRTRLRGFRELYGKQWNKYLNDVAAAINQTPTEPLAYSSPADVMQAAIRRNTDDLILLERVRAAQVGNSRKRRAATAVRERPLDINTPVRLLNMQYVKQGKQRTNAMKFGPRWSRRVYRITAKQSLGNNVYRYTLDKPNSQKYLLTQLQVVPGTQAGAPQMVHDPVDYPVFRVIGKRRRGARVEYNVLFDGYPAAEWTAARNAPAALVAEYEAGLL